MAGLVTDLLADIKRKGFFQADGTVLSDADFIDAANKELQNVIVPKILSVRERYFTCYKDYNLGTLKRLRLPSRIAGGRIFDLQIVDGNGVPYSLNEKSSGEISGRQGFFIDNNEIVFSNNFNTVPVGRLRCTYPCRPPLMSTSAVIAATVVSASGSVIVPSTSITGTYEVIRQDSPYSTIAPAVSFVSLSGTNPDDTSGDDVANYFTPGDIIISPNSTMYVPLPLELHDWLAARVVSRVNASLGRSMELQNSEKEVKKIEADLSALINPRVENGEKVFMDKETLGWRYW
jgi:hypothetical protein